MSGGVDRVVAGIRWVRPPQQDRSRRTLNGLLDATESLLADRTFDDITIGDVVARAESSVGAFYARFSDKEELLDAVYDRHQGEAFATIAATLDPDRWKDATAGEIVEQLIHFVADLYTSKRGLMRALVLRGYTKPDPRYRDPAFLDQTAIRRFGALIATHREEVDHPDPVLAGEMGCTAVLALARESLLFGESTSAALIVDRAAFERELCRMICSYLRIDGPAGNR